MKLDFIVNDVDLDTSYGLIKITSSSSTTSSLFDSFFCFLVLYMYPIHQPTFSKPDMLDLPYCFELNTVNLLIFLGFL